MWIVTNPADLNEIIFDQLGQNLVSKDLTFDIGYYRGNKRMNILGSDDMKDVRKLLHNNRSFITHFVVYGTISKKNGDSGKRTLDQLNTDSDPGAKKPKCRKKSAKKSGHEKKLEKIDNITGKLKTKHGF